MLKTKKENAKGFTLIEIILVLAIVGMIVFMMAGYLQQQTLNSRIDRTSQQMQQILNAGLSYFVANGAWPPITDPNNSLGCLFGGQAAPSSCVTQYLLPSPSTSGAQQIVNPWGAPIQIITSNTLSGSNAIENGCTPSASAPNTQNCALLYVYTEISGDAAYAVANAIAGKLPMAYTSTSAIATNGPAPEACAPGATTCYVIAAVNIPGQNLNNAAAVNFAGLYHHGGCVPVPQCPVNTTPQVLVVPVSVSGIISNPSAGSTVPQVYPISSFTAYATGGTDASPAACDNSISPPPDCSKNYVGNQASYYWRACLQIITENGNVQTQQPNPSVNSDWGSFVTLMAMTRCAINNEPAGTSYNTTVYGN